MKIITGIIAILLNIIVYQVEAAVNDKDEIEDNPHPFTTISFRDLGILKNFKANDNGSIITYVKKPVPVIGFHNYIPNLITRFYYRVSKRELPKQYESFVREKGLEQSLGINSYVDAIDDQGKLLIGEKEEKAGIWEKNDKGYFLFNPLPNTLNPDSQSCTYVCNEVGSIIYGAYYDQQENKNIGCLWIKGKGNIYSQFRLRNQRLHFQRISQNYAVGTEHFEDPYGEKGILASINSEGEVVVEEEYLPSYKDETFYWELNDKDEYVQKLSDDFYPKSLTNCDDNSSESCKYYQNQIISYESANKKIKVSVGAIIHRCSLNPNTKTAMVWVEELGMHTLESILKANGQQLPTDYKLSEDINISKNGQFIFGTADFEGNLHNWRVDIIGDITRLRFPSSIYITINQAAQSEDPIVYKPKIIRKTVESKDKQ